MKNRKSKLTFENSDAENLDAEYLNAELSGTSGYETSATPSNTLSVEALASPLTPTSTLISNPSTLNSKQIADTAIRIAIEQKGLDVFGYDVNGMSDVADHIVVISATSERHGKGIADKIRAALQEACEKPVSVSGYDGGEWILLDYADTIIHIFHEPTRQYYEFDDLWKDADTLDFSPELEAAARKLRTGIYISQAKHS